MRIADLKKQAQVLEQGGDAAAALTIYDEILGELERLALQPDGALCVKIGDLSLKAGQRSRAVSLFELAAEEYAREGSHKAVTALCLKILRTNPRRKDSHIRYAKQLFHNGHLEAARLVLLDYAERTGLEKTRDTLQSLSERSETEQKAKLEKFFEMAARASTRSGERPAVSAPRPSVSISETTEHLAVMAQSLKQERAEPDPIVAAIMESKPAAETAAPKSVEREPDEKVHHVAALSVVDGGQTAKSEERTSSFDRVRHALKSRRLWPWPAAAAAVLVLGIGLMGFGAVPFGGDLDADEPEVMAPVPVATAAVLGAPMIGTTASNDSIMPAAVSETAAINGPMTQVDVERPESETVLTQAPDTNTAVLAERGIRDVTPSAPTQLTGLDRGTIAAASQVAIDVDVSAADLDDDLTDAGRIAIPVSMHTRSATPNAPPSAPSADRLIVAIDGLEIVGTAGSANNYRVVQRLDSGASVTIAVIPFANAPAGENGQLDVQAGPGDSAIGTRRFYDSFVTVEAEVKLAAMEDLLGKLAEQRWR